MSLHRRAAKRDAAEPAIVSALEALGCIVWRVSGKGLPDLVVFCPKSRAPDGFRRRTFVADVKGQKEKATPAQEEKWTALINLGFSVFILRTPEDAAKMLNNALQPWEPVESVVRKVMRSHEDLHARRECSCYPANTLPRKGNAAKSREEGLKRLGMGHSISRLTEDESRIKKARKGDAAKAREDGRKRLDDEQWDVPLPGGRRLRNKPRTGAKAGRPDYVEAYTPTRSKPVDATRPRSSLGAAMMEEMLKPPGKENYEKALGRALSAAKEAEETFAPRNPCCGNYEAFGIHAEVCEHYAG